MNNTKRYFEEVKKLLDDKEIDGFSFEVDAEIGDLYVAFEGEHERIALDTLQFADNSHDPEEDAKEVLITVRDSIKKTKQASKIYKEIEDTAEVMVDDFRKRPDYKGTWQFNIKLYGDMPTLPEKYEDKEISDDLYWDFLRQELGDFMEYLKDKFDWIEDWWVNGRSGGWLILEDSMLDPEDLDLPTDMYVFANSFDRDELENAKELEKEWEQRWDDLNTIKKMIREGQKNLQKDFEIWLEDSMGLNI